MRITVQFVVVLCVIVKCYALFFIIFPLPLKSVAKSSSLFICMAAVRSGELGSLSLQLCSDQSQEFKFVHFPDSTNCS